MYSVYATLALTEHPKGLRACTATTNWPARVTRPECHVRKCCSDFLDETRDGERLRSRPRVALQWQGYVEETLLGTTYTPAKFKMVVDGLRMVQ